ncbi:MAG: AMP-binding protein [Cephaloticoccus sp.]|nr:AMP-binding protein [Cephaloticoccus sp.]
MERAELEALVRATGVAEEHGGYVFLRDPYWSPAQCEAFDALTRSVVCNPRSEIANGWLCIPTGGSSGGLKFARHDEATLTAAVRGFISHFQLQRVDAIDVLPPWHVSGLMARVRCAATGGRHVAWDWKRLERGEFPALDGDGWLISIVPTQVQRLLQQPAAVDWLQRLHLIFVGGGPVWPELAVAMQAAGLPVILSYGMTETAAMVTAQRPGDFARGDRSSGVALPHAHITIDPMGTVCVAGESVMRGYLGAADLAGEWVTADSGRLDDGGRLHISGRRDEVAITGGEKVNLTDVEEALRGLGEVAVVALPDAEWGEIVVACYLQTGRPLSDASVGAKLSRQQRPKHWLAFAPTEWPRNAQGKLNRAALRAAASARLNPSREG